MVWLGWLDLDVALVWRACAGAAGVLAILTVLGYAPSRLLCAGALRPYRWPLAPLVPNQDDEYFVDSVDYMWHTPHGLRLNLGGGRIETGWPYHLLVATFRPFTVVDDYEAMPLAGYVAVALAVAPTTLLFHREL